MKNLNDLSVRVNQADGSLGKMIVGEPFLAKLDALSDHTDTLMRSLTLASNALAVYGQSAKGSNEFYGNVNESMVTLHRTIGSLDSLLIDLKKNPKRYLNISVF